MASLLNSVYDGSANFTGGYWEDVKDYTSAILTLRSAFDGSGTIEWADTSGRRLPNNNDIVASESFNYMGISGQALTKQFDHRARWFRVRYDHSGVAGVDYSAYTFKDVSLNLQTLYKKAPTELKIVDDSANIVSVNIGPSGNSLYTVLTDSSGVLIRTTNPAQTSGQALFVHLADSSGRSLATTNTGKPESLFVSLRDASNVALDSTGTSNNALFVRPGDVCGNAQASTFSVSGAYTNGVALYGALADNCGIQIDTTSKLGFQPATGGTTANALYVTLADAYGHSISATNPLPVITTVESTGAMAFDVSSGIVQDFISPDASLSSSGGKKINLYNICVYNDGPTTAWLKVYDVSSAGLNDVSLLAGVGPNTPQNETLFSSSFNRMDVSTTALRYNLTVPAGRYRDLVLPGGATFNYGAFFRATTQHRPNSVAGPGANTVFLNGSYTVE